MIALKWIVTITMVVTFLAVSCGLRLAEPVSVPIATPAPRPVSSALTPMPTPGLPPSAPTLAEKPKYGGTINVIQNDANVLEGWDAAAVPIGMGAASQLVLERLVETDWAKGSGGSGQIDFGKLPVAQYDGFGPNIVEGWEYHEGGTWVLNIRKGIRFALNSASEASRLVNGRGLTADDIVWNIKRYYSDPAFPQSMPRRFQPAMSQAVAVEKTGQWEVTLKTPVDPWTGFFWVVWGGSSQRQFAPEVIQRYGNGSDWRNAVGTGPFMVTDIVPGSAGTLIRNPNWHEKDPVGLGKGNQTPYLDTIKILIVPDISTRLAAMRTGRADWVTGVEQEDAMGLMRTNPQVMSKGYQPGGYGIRMWIDRPDLPFKDKRVRQALMMAIDYEAMKNDLYGGKAEIQIWPVTSALDWVFVPMKDLPETVQALYSYNPQRAKQLLAEAGYPNGFKTKMIVRNISAAMDPAAAIKAMWAKVGVELEIHPREPAVFSSIVTAVSWEETFYNVLAGSSAVSLYAFTGAGLRATTSTINRPDKINDPVIEEAYQKVQKNIILNFPKADQIFREITPYVMEQAYIIPVASPYSYTLWQPWVKNHYGESTLVHWLPYAWIDQDLKEQMTGRR